MSKYTPHSDKDVLEMLSAVGVKSLDDLYADAPKSLVLDKLDIPAGKSQMAVEKNYRHNNYASSNSSNIFSYVSAEASQLKLQHIARITRDFHFSLLS